MFRELRDRVLEEPLTYIIIGAVLAITLARTYVFLGGDLNLMYDGVTLHHFFFGAILVAIIGIIFFDLSEHHLKSRLKKSVLALFFGMGLGLMIDEANLLLVGGQNYTLAQYYSPTELSIESGVLILLFCVLMFRILVGSIRHRKSRRNN